MTPIRRGDGTGLDPKGFTEVRKGDGTVLWSAISDSVIDNYEDADADPPGPYRSGDSLSDYYSGDIGAYERTTSSVLEGDYSLYAESQSQNDYIYSVEGDGLPHYPKKGEKFSILMRPGTKSNQEACFGTPGSPSDGENVGYCVRLNPSSNEIALIKRLGSFDFLDTASETVNAGDDYEFVVEWHDGDGSESEDTIVATVYEYDVSDQSRGSEVASVSAKDSDGATNVGIAFTEGREDKPDNYWDGYSYEGAVEDNSSG